MGLFGEAHLAKRSAFSLRGEPFRQGLGLLAKRWTFSLRGGTFQVRSADVHFLDGMDWHASALMHAKSPPSPLVERERVCVRERERKRERERDKERD